MLHNHRRVPTTTTTTTTTTATTTTTTTTTERLARTQPRRSKPEGPGVASRPPSVQHVVSRRRRTRPPRPAAEHTHTRPVPPLPTPRVPIKRSRGAAPPAPYQRRRRLSRWARRHWFRFFRLVNTNLLPVDRFRVADAIISSGRSPSAVTGALAACPQHCRYL